MCVCENEWKKNVNQVIEENFLEKKLISFLRDTDKRNKTKWKKCESFYMMNVQHLTGMQSVIHFSLFCQAIEREPLNNHS